MLLRSPKALEQVKVGNISENLLNENHIIYHQIIYFLHWVKEVTKKTYVIIMNSIKV